MSYVMYEMFGRLSRNAFIVLALIIPIVAGMGINFAITIGAMAAQIAALWVIEWGVGGFGGFLLAMLMTMPIAGLFGFLIGKLLNKMKGQEMIGGLILGYLPTACISCCSCSSLATSSPSTPPAWSSRVPPAWPIPST